MQLQPSIHIRTINSFKTALIDHPNNNHSSIQPPSSNTDHAKTKIKSHGALIYLQKSPNMKNHRLIQREMDATKFSSFPSSSAPNGKPRVLQFFFICFLLDFLRPNIFKNKLNIALKSLRFFLNFFKALGIIKNVSLGLGQQNLLTFPYPVHCSHIFIVFIY